VPQDIPPARLLDEIMRHRLGVRIAQWRASPRKSRLCPYISERSSAVTRGTPMSVIWKSRGTVGPGSTDAGTYHLPLRLIDERLARYKVHFQGEEPKPIAPATTYFNHVVVEVTGLDEPTARFDRRGFYRVLGLHVEDAGFLFEAPPAAAHKG
jgi:hypothetical protein